MKKTQSPTAQSKKIGTKKTHGIHDPFCNAFRATFFSANTEDCLFPVYGICKGSLGTVTNISLFSYIFLPMIVKEQIKAARAMLDIKQSELATMAGVSLATLNNIERGADSRVSTLQKIKAALQNKGIEFFGVADNSPGISLKAKVK